MVHQARDMPAALASNTASSTTDAPHTTSHTNRRISSEQTRRSAEYTTATPATETPPGGWPSTPGANGALNGSIREGIGGKDGSILSVPNGTNGSERAPSAKSMALSMRSRRSAGNLTAESERGDRRSGEAVKENTTRPGVAEEGYFASLANGKPVAPTKSPLKKPVTIPNGDVPSMPRSVSHSAVPMTPKSALPPLEEASPQTGARTDLLKPPSAKPHRASSPPAFDPSAPRPERLSQRHTLEVPRVDTSRNSKDSAELIGNSLDGQISSTTGRFSPNTPTRRRASLNLTRRHTRSVHSDLQLDEAAHDEDAQRWAEHIRAKRASKRQRTETDDDRVVVGTKVDENHVNFATAYNMLTGIRFTVSRTNAKMDRELSEADFVAKHKFSFDINGNELTPGSKYDFKFKDYAPWVFRHLRSNFKIDPADYLMSLTSKYILSELGSPGKSGSFFYFSRDYKYIIKTIHHGEHKFLRKILRDYYQHVKDNPDTLLSQFYGLHRVKIPFGRKIHFVVMNNLFPPHRDIHRTFDLKGSTIGRDFHEADLEKNPRATLKDLNWLRRGLHLEFGPTKKDAFVQQMQRDVALLQKLKIMDYSLLVGIHDLERGNEENLRDKTLQVFQPGGDKQEEQTAGPHQLARTPSKMENAKRAKELREMVKKERPIPMEQTLDKLPEESHKSSFYFYADDGGFRATHEDDRPGEEIYYLGIIDCLTRYNYVKKAEHFWKGMGGHESQISPIPPDRYGDRFVRFISGITMSRERAHQEKEQEKERVTSQVEVNAGVLAPAGIANTLDDPALGGINMYKADASNPPGTAEVMRKAEHQAEKSRRRGSHEEDVPERTIGAVRSPLDPPGEQATLPVIGEAAESASNNSRHATPSASHEDVYNKNQVILGNANMPSEALGDIPPPTPPKMDGSVDRRSLEERQSWGGRPPPTPPKDERHSRTFGKDLPLPPATKTLSHSPNRLGELDFEFSSQTIGSR
ncbi:Phosphatidylinositol 4-phosphate 5-kinase its3 [Fulvia fulva]|uniref:1-phosphatidylinositol-4-phosphate 5-kinase n=1 Tax=Passalora fulva TaxID=5499 RepID=A0A9Q8UVB6_PASFU|nr:Phosphatidylinositol 4-phosphate 5-kinase its3 [Fulvia fulva]KAK4612970.1 Phosphatidylinositol 4-phosphate 5-kinase its3 [Fulvia fulva]UJO23798.1 Phosphatidylinositol 4-phosphate 5-kinase its3 [Fulvia fulva]